MKVIYWAATLVFIGMVARHVSLYGKEWEFSPRGIPVSILSQNGRTYGDDRRIDAINLGIIQSGNEEKTMGFALAAVGGVIIFFAVQVVKLNAVIRDNQRCGDLSREVDRLRSVGKWAEADRVLDQYGEIVERMKRRAKQ